jgi:hypothetical protein
MKTKFLFFLRKALSRIFLVLALIPGLLYSLDVSFSLMVNLEHSPAYFLPVDFKPAFFLWASTIACLISAATLGGWVLNKQASKKTIRYFLLTCFFLFLVILAGFDVIFCHKICMSRSILFKFPISKWVLVSMMPAGIFLFIVFANLLEKILDIIEPAEENLMSETDKD